MDAAAQQKTSAQRKRGKGRTLALVVAALVVMGAGGLAVFAHFNGSRGGLDVALYPVLRGDLTISVLEGGNIRATRSVEIRNEVSGQRRIISIVPEGYQVTQEDVEKGKVLVEIDSSDLQERVAQQEVSYQSAKASWKEAQESLLIREHQNASDIMRGEMSERFARMDLEKYLGAQLGPWALEQFSEGELDIPALSEHADLDGESLQQLRRRAADIDLAKEELQRAKDRLEWTERLFELKQVSRNDVEADALALQRRENALAEAKTASYLYLQYDFPRQVERLISEVIEKERELERIEARARSELAKAEGNLLSREASYRLQKNRRDEYLEELENCTIRATRPGMVVYASSVAQRWRGDPIEEGATVRQRQAIITLPDVSEMSVTVRVHEAFADRVSVGQRALVSTDATPDRPLEGEVSRVAVLPDPQSRWLSSGVNVYSTDIQILENNTEGLRPGMSARAEIIVAELEDVLYIPIQAVTHSGPNRVAYVATGGGYEQRPIQTGLFNDRFIEVREGLEEGEMVLLYPPEDETGDGVPGRERPSERERDNGRMRPGVDEDQDGQLEDLPIRRMPDEGDEGRGGEAGLQTPDREAGDAEQPQRRERRPEGGGEGRQRPAGQERPQRPAESQ